MSVTVVINSAEPLLERLKDATLRGGLALVGARAVANLTKDHLIALDGERHRFGRNYYLQAARSVFARAIGDGQAAVTISQVGIRQRLFGGPITPKAPKRYLTIPANAEAYGRRAGEFHDLDFQLVEHDGRLRAALVRRASTAVSFTRRKRKDGSVKVTVKPGELRGGEVMFWLVRRVLQQPDPSVLPSGEKMSGAAVGAMAIRIARINGRENPESSS